MRTILYNISVSLLWRLLDGATNVYIYTYLYKYILYIYIKKYVYMNIFIYI